MQGLIEAMYSKVVDSGHRHCASYFVRGDVTADNDINSFAQNYEHEAMF